MLSELASVVNVNGKYCKMSWINIAYCLNVSLSHQNLRYNEDHPVAVFCKYTIKFKIQIIIL